MLQRAGRWLRAAGYDVAIAECGESDAQLLAQARREGRLLLTRDRELAQRCGAEHAVLLLRSNTLRGQLREITQRLAIDWFYRPFSRCMACNTPLRAAPPELVAQVPPAAIREGERLLCCPRCNKVYWEGSHVKRMRRQLERFSRGEWEDGE